MAENVTVNQLEHRIQTYRKRQFTGLVQVSRQANVQWVLYFLLGRIVWTDSRTHTLRRWQRHLNIYSPVFAAHIAQHPELSPKSWHYTGLAKLVKLKKFRRDQFSHIVENCIAEDLFDIVYIGTLQHNKTSQTLGYEAIAASAADLPFIMLQQDLTWQNALQTWQSWETTGLAKCSPDWVPVITQPEALKEQTPPQTFKTLTTLVDGTKTLRDLALRFKKPLIPLTKSLLPYISRGLLSLTEIPDLVEPNTLSFRTAVNKSPQAATSGQVPTSNSIPNSVAPATATHSTSPSVQRLNTPPSAVLRLATASQAKKPPGIDQHLAADPQRALFKPAPTSKAKSNAPMIVYIDDSPADSRAMAEIVEAAGYQYTNIPEPLQALPLLLELKPKLIFLDLVMPIANGYEVCAQIRRIAAFKDTPVIIVTSNDGIADRVRAKVVGASGFIGKPIQPKKVLKVLEQITPVGA